jgi:hypothetical protein
LNYENDLEPKLKHINTTCGLTVQMNIPVGTVNMTLALPWSKHAGQMLG